MRLENLKQPWSDKNRAEKISLIERTQEKRLKAFEARKKKKSKKSKSKSKSKKKSRKSKSYTKPKTPEELMKMKKNMSKEEWENFKMMVNMSNG